MPNWCENKLEIYAKKNVISQLEKIAYDKQENNIFSLYRFFSPPEILEITSDNIVSEKQFLKYVNRRFSLLKTVPISISFRQYLINKYEAASIDDWNFKMFGVDRDCVDSNLIESSKEMLVYSFKTAWGPPIQFVKNLTKKYPCSCTLYYYESGMDISGYVVVKEGNIVESADQLSSEEIYNLFNIQE